MATPEYRFRRDHTTIALLPVAAPSGLGLYGFAAATFMVVAKLAGWYGNAETPLVLSPFALAAGGIAQLLAGMWGLVRLPLLWRTSRSPQSWAR